MGIEIGINSGHQIITDLAPGTTVYAPLYYNATTEPKYTLTLGTIQKETGKINTGVTSYDIPGLKSSERICLDMKGAIGQYSFSGVYTGTATQCSDFMILMYAIGNIGGLQCMQTALYTITYTATDKDGVARFPTYPTAYLSSNASYGGGVTKKSMKGIVTDVQLSRDDSTPDQNIVRWSFTFHEAAQL